MGIKPVGELVFVKDGHEYCIPATQVSQGELKKEADGFQGESEDWSVIFTVVSVAGEFAWHVTYTIGNEGLDITDFDRVKTPSGVEVIKNPSFKSV